MTFLETKAEFSRLNSLSIFLMMAADQIESDPSPESLERVVDRLRGLGAELGDRATESLKQLCAMNKELIQ
jgi:hypothetical protein